MINTSRILSYIWSHIRPLISNLINFLPETSSFSYSPLKATLPLSLLFSDRLLLTKKVWTVSGWGFCVSGTWISLSLTDKSRPKLLKQHNSYKVICLSDCEWWKIKKKKKERKESAIDPFKSCFRLFFFLIPSCVSFLLIGDFLLLDDYSSGQIYDPGGSSKAYIL